MAHSFRHWGPWTETLTNGLPGISVKNGDKYFNLWKIFNKEKKTDCCFSACSVMKVSKEV